MMLDKQAVHARRETYALWQVARGCFNGRPLRGGRS